MNTLLEPISMTEVKAVLLDAGFMVMKADVVTSRYVGHYWSNSVNPHTVSITPTKFRGNAFERWRSVLEDAGYTAIVDPNDPETLLVTKFADPSTREQSLLDLDDDTELQALLAAAQQKVEFRTHHPWDKDFNPEEYWFRPSVKPRWVVIVLCGRGKKAFKDLKLVSAKDEAGARRTAIFFCFFKGYKSVVNCRLALPSDMLTQGYCHVPNVAE